MFRFDIGDVTNLHDLDKLEKQLFSVLGFLLLNYQRAHPAGQKETPLNGVNICVRKMC